MDDELLNFGQRLADFFKGRSAAKHWSGGGVQTRPREPNSNAFPYHLGHTDAAEAARTAAEQRLLCGPGARLPRWTARYNGFVMTAFADLKQPNKFTVQHVVEPHNVASRSSILEYEDFVGRQILLVQNIRLPGFNPLPGSEESHVIVANDFWTFTTEGPYGREKVHDLVAIF
jgi:hypothetical protein